MTVLSRLDRYIGKTVLQSTLLVLTILVVLFTFLKFVDALGDYGQGKFGLLAIAKYVLLTLPGWVYSLFPVAALLGSILGLGGLALASELTAMRAAGISLSRIVGSVMKTGLLFVACGILIGELVVPVTETHAQRERAEAMEIGLHQERSGLWLRDGPLFVNIGEVLPDRTLLRVDIYRFDNRARLKTQTSAERGRFADNAAGWRLEGVKSSRLEETGVSTRTLDHYIWLSPVTPAIVEVFTVRPEALSTWHLYRYIKHLRRNHQETERYELAFWNKLLLPAAIAVMVLLATPFVVTQPRGGGTGRNLLLGILLALGFVALGQAFGHFSLLIKLPPLVGALAPVLVFLALATQLLRRAAHGQSV